jgi:hypothetical protein
MAHNIEGFEEHYEMIETKKFYRKYDGQISINNKVKIIAETKEAILVREKIQVDKEEYGIQPLWISKTKIIKRERV